ncbi:MAG: ATP-binding protein [Desulfosporosinus sp.]|nr:ATP-binding protein [Desulfosporosinus sp.]
MVKNIGSSNLENRSHEIRTFMTRIIGLTDLTLMTELTEEQRDYLTTVKSSTKLLSQILNDILDHSKIQTAKSDLEKVPFDIWSTIYEVVDSFQVAVKRKNISLRVDHIDKAIPKNLIGDSSKLKQILINLVSNSVRFTINGEVTLTVDVEEQLQNTILLKFMVADTGIGISEDQLVRLFSRSSPVDDYNSKESSGTGLGLIISKKLVELMNGNIYLESKVGVGSKVCFTVEFGV